MNNCLRDFIISINNIELESAQSTQKKRIDRYLEELEEKWKNGSAENQQLEKTFLKIVGG